MRLHCGVEFVKKDTWVVDAKKAKEKRKTSVTKTSFLEKYSENVVVNFTLIMFCQL